ncbi:MAG TPA: outer membrane protein assembly factor BamA [Devosia sp.]|nr:outer membrane protein assembly factor BamA [Devosia sp.]
MIDRNKLTRSVFLALALLIAAPLAGAALPIVGVVEAQAATVSKISVSGNHVVDTATILATIGVKVGENADAGALSQASLALYKTGLFKTASVTQSGGIVFVKVTENPIVASVLFQGNQRFSDAELLTMVSAASQGSYSPDRVQGDVATIKNAYKQVGYTNVTVTPQTQTVDGGRVRVTFVINEGTRSAVAAINFTGNRAFSTSTLQGVIRTKQTGFLSWLTHDDSYSDAQLEIDKQLVRLYYANHGYPDAQVTSAVAEYDPKRNGYFITYTVVEGDKYTYGPTAIETSIPNLNTKTLQDTVQTPTGSSFSQSDLQKTTSDMAFRATAEGFPFADVRPRVDRDLAAHKLNITYLVDNGPRVYVERINITGNQKTRDFVIRRELDFAEGDPFNMNLLARDKDNIQKLGFFKSVDITTEPGSAPDKVIVDIAVVEQSTGDYGITAGYSTQDGILGEVSLTERNFLGRGQFVRAAVGASASGRTFDFSFTEPRFMGLKVSSGIDLYHHIATQTQTSFYGVTTTGGQVRLGMPITDTLSGNIYAGAEQSTFSTSGDCTDATGAGVDCAGPTASPPITQNWPTSQVVADGQVKDKAFIGYNLNFSTLDDQKNPTSGLYAVLSQQYAGWDSNFVKTEAKARYFMPIGETGMVASLRGQAGVIYDVDGSTVNATDSFKEGTQLVRGFENGGFGPRLMPQGIGGVQGEPIGETAYAGLSAEVQFPIPVLPEQYGLKGAIWADGAYVDGVPTTGSGTLDPASMDNKLRASVGTSIIWDSPFGPLRGDFGYAVSKASADRTQIFQLTLQTLL